jgi:tripartite-type tricarboxylate transporter receptor subunit TctC
MRGDNGGIMKLPRRIFLQLGAVAAMSRIACAQAYPSRPVRTIVGFSAGSGPDIAARLMGQWLSERLGQPFVVENQPGAAGNIGAELVARAAPDGHTLLLVTAQNAVNATLHDNLSFNFTSDIAPVASIGRTPFVMVVNPSVPAKTLPEFIAYAKANPGKINMASAGNGTMPHFLGELFKMMTGVDMLHVPYSGSLYSDLLGGQTQVLFGPVLSTIGYIKAGKLRALAVTTATRLEVLPDIPTVAEFVPGYEASGWLGIAVPKNTSADIISKLNNGINAALADPAMKARFADLGATVLLPGSPADFGKLIADETEKWGKVIKFANIKPE